MQECPVRNVMEVAKLRKLCKDRKVMKGKETPIRDSRSVWDRGSFTVEAALVVPLVIFLIVMVLHLAVELEQETIVEAQKDSAVQSLRLIDEMYQ